MGERLSSPSLDTAALRHVLSEAIADWTTHKDELRRLDAILGDGDMGVTIELAGAAILDVCAGFQGDDIGALLVECGTQINRQGPSTFGTLLAAAFTAVGTATTGRPDIRVDELGYLGERAIEGIKARGRSDIGEKTLLDAIVPAVSALALSLKEGRDAPEAIRAGLSAGESGAEATRWMAARHGRASYRRDGGQGELDAGARAMYLLMQSVGGSLVAYCNAAALQPELPPLSGAHGVSPVLD